jgi:hypothetical protein
MEHQQEPLQSLSFCFRPQEAIDTDEGMQTEKFNLNQDFRKITIALLATFILSQNKK